MLASPRTGRDARVPPTCSSLFRSKRDCSGQREVCHHPCVRMS